MENFWPTIDTKQTDTPLALMKIQGEFLEKHTSGILTYKVVKQPFKHEFFKSGEGIRFEFYIVAPHMDNYKFMLFSVVHDLVFTYPTTIDYYNEEDTIEVNSREEFEETLKNILSQQSTKNILESLLSQSSE